MKKTILGLLEVKKKNVTQENFNMLAVQVYPLKPEKHSFS